MEPDLLNQVVKKVPAETTAILARFAIRKIIYNVWISGKKGEIASLFTRKKKVIRNGRVGEIIMRTEERYQELRLVLPTGINFRTLFPLAPFSSPPPYFCGLSYFFDLFSFIKILLFLP